MTSTFSIRVWLMAATAMLCAACGPSVIVSRTGTHAAKPDSCEIEFSQMDANAAYVEFEQVGTAVVQHVDVSKPADAKERDSVRRHACRIGGSMVVPSVSTSNLRAYLVFGAKRKTPLLAASKEGGDAPPAPSQPPPKAGPKAIVAVFDIEDRSKQLSADDLGQLSDYLATQLANTPELAVVPRGQLRARLVEQKTESFRACFDETCQIEIGKAMAAQKSLATKLLKVGGRCAITANLFDLKKEATETAASVQTDCSSTSLLSGIDQLVKKLTGGR
jgi:hypothetical protein